MRQRHSDFKSSASAKYREERARRRLSEKLEQRVLFDAVVDPQTVESAFDASDSEFYELGQTARAFESNSQSEGAFSVSSARDVAFIDTSVEDIDLLISDIQQRSDEIELIFLDPTRDGLQQIADHLEGRRGIQAIHILSHGDEGRIALGQSVISTDQLTNQYADALSRIGSSLTNSADILFYGCELAGNEDGRSFVNTFARLTGADVAASDDVTGNEAVGGDWILEHATGTIETAVVIDPAVQALYTERLQLLDISAIVVSDGTPSFDTNDDPGNDSSSLNGIVRSHDIVTIDLFYNTDSDGATNPYFEVTLPFGMVFDSLPAVAALDSRSGIFDSDGTTPGGDMRHMKMYIPDISGTISSNVTVVARALGVANDTPIDDIKFYGGSDENLTLLETPEDIDFKISSAASTDVWLDGATFRGGYTDASGTVDGVVYSYTIGLLGDHPTRSGSDAVKGSAPLTDPIEFTVDLSGVSSGAQIFSWGDLVSAPDAQDGITRNYEYVTGDGTAWSRSNAPRGQIDDHNTGTWNSDRSTPDSGDWNVVGVTGSEYSIEITGADTTGSSFPSQTGSGGVLDADQKWFASGQLHVWIPIADVAPGNDGTLGNDDDGLLTIAPEITKFDPDDAFGLTNNFGTGTEDTSNNSYSHDVITIGLGGPTKRNSEFGIWQWVETASYWNGGDGVTSVGHQYDSFVTSGQNAGVLELDGVIFGDKFDNTSTKIVPISDYSGANRSNHQWSRVYLAGGGPSEWLQEGTDYVIEFASGGVDGAVGGWTDWDSMGDATLADDQAATVWTDDPTDIATLGGTADPDTLVSDAITKYRIRLNDPLRAGGTVYGWVSMESTGLSTLDPTNNPDGDIIANFVAGTADFLQQDADLTNDWRTSEYDPATNQWYTGGSSSDVWRGDRLTLVEAAVRVDKTVVDIGSGNLFLAGSAATVQLVPTVTIPGPDSGAPAKDVWVTDVLPGGLTVVGGSANLSVGDTYIAGDGSTQTVQAIEYWNGASWSSTFSYGASGIRFGFGDVPLNTALPTIQFDVLIPFDAQNGETWENTAVISSPSDSTPDEWRDSQAGLVAVQVAAMSVGKEVITPEIPEDGTISFALGVANVSDDKVIPWFDAVDILPFDGDANGSSFSGSITSLSVTGLDPTIDVYVTTVSGATLDAQDGVVDGYGDPGNDGTHAWYVAPGTGDWQYTLDDVIAGTLGAPTLSAITALRFVSDPSFDLVTPHLPADSSFNWQLHIETDGNIGIPSDSYTNSMTSRTSELVLPLPVQSPPATAKVVAPDVEIEKETCLDETGTLCDPTDDSHWGETATFDDTNETTFRIKITNTGTSTFDATVTDVLPAGLTYVAGTATASTGDVSGFPNTWTATLAVGQSAYLVFTAETSDAGTYNNTADVDVVDQFGQMADDSDDSSITFISEVTVTKQQTGVVRSSTNPDEFHVSYEVELMNTSEFDLYDLTLTEDLDGAFGAAYQGVETDPAISSSTISVGGSLPTLNGNFDGNLGGTGDDQILDANGLLKAGDSVTVTYTVTVDVTELADAANTFNQVTAGGDSGGGPVSDLSDDGDDPTSTNSSHPGDTGGSDDPTPLRIPLIELEKEVTGTAPANSGTNGNFDVTYQFTIDNVGTTDLVEIALTEDLLANLGGAFVGIVNGPTVTMTTATDNPDFHIPYDGGVSDDNVFATSPVNTQLLLGGSTAASYFGKQTVVSDNSVVIDPNQTYELSVQANADDGAGGAPDPSSRHYLGFASYDVDGNFVSMYNYSKETGAVDTTLATALNPGDTTITLSDATGWYDGSTSHRRSIAWYGYTDSTGYTYPDYDYTRNFETNAWDEGAISGNTITLSSPWTGPALAAGDAVRNTKSGGTYQYVLLSNGHIDLAGGTYTQNIGGGFIANGAGATTLWRPGTHSIRALTLADFGNDSVRLNLNDWELKAPNESLLEPGQEVTFEITVEIDPDAAGAIYDSISSGSVGALENQASVAATDPFDGTVVTDNSDDPTDPTDSDNEGDLDPDDPVGLFLPNIELAKTQVGVPVTATSGAVGNVEVTYDLQVTNTGNDDLVNLSLAEDLATQYGGAFVAIVPQSGSPATVVSSSASDGVEINAGYNGSSNTQLIDNATGTNLLKVGQSVTVRIVIEIDPDSPTAIYNNSSLQNQASISADGVGSGSTVTDDSDDPTDSSNNDNDADNDPDDPNLLSIPQIALAKSIVGDPFQLANGNWTVQYQFIVENIGTTFLTNLQTIEDFAAEFGAGVFQRVVAAPVISVEPTDPSSTAPTRNVNYNGDTDTNLLDGISGLLAPNDSFTIGITVELDPNDPSAILPFENTATTSGDAALEDGSLITSGGSPVSVKDDSDSGTNPESTNAGELGDTGGTNDPTPLYIADLDITKAISGTPTALPNGNFSVNYSVLVANTGTVDLADLSLVEDVQSQFGAGFASVSNLGFATNPSDPDSSITLDTAGWAGTSAAADMIDSSATNLLAAGDSFTIEFTVEVDAAALPTATSPTVYTDEATFVAATGATLREDFTDVVGNTSVTLPFTSTQGVQITGAVTSSLGTGLETRESETSFAGQAPDPGVFAIRQLDGGDATLRITVPNPGHAIGIGIADVFDPAGGNPAGQYTYLKVTASDGTVLFEHDEQDGADLPANGYQFLGIQGTGSQTYTHIDIEYVTNGNDNFTLDHIYDLGNSDNVIENQIVGSANAVDENGDPILDSNDNPVTISDESDSGTEPDDSNSGDPGDTGSHDDPTPLLIPNLSLTKARFGAPVPAASGTTGNFDVTYDLTVTSIGNEPVNMLSLVEDLQTQYGDAFVRIVPQSGASATIITSTASDTPELNAAYDGGTIDSQIFDNTGANTNLLMPRESVTVRIVIEIDPDNAGATKDSNQNLVNQASVTGSGITTGNPADDLSDDPSNTTDADGDPNDSADDDGNPDDPNLLRLPSISLQKQVFGLPTPASSGTANNYDVFYDLAITNTGSVALDQLSLVENFASNFGGAFVRIVPQSGAVATIVSSTASDDLEFNAAYDGGTSDAQIIDNTGGNANLLDVGQTVTIRLLVEIDPNNTSAIYDGISGDANGDLENQASVTGTDSGNPSGPTTVNDNSDDPTDATNSDDDSDNDPDDPTGLLIPEITLEKRLVGSPVPATSGATGNFDVTYDLVIENTGIEDLQALTLVEDVATQYGGGFVRIVGTPSVNASTASDDPELNASYDGGTTNAQLFDNSGSNSSLLEVGQSLTVRVTFEVDPDNATAITDASGNFVNQAETEGTGAQTGFTVDDESDDPSNATDIDGDSDNEADDPNLIRFPAIDLTKIVSSSTPPTKQADGTWDVVFELEMTNTGSTPLNNLALFDNVSSPSNLGTAWLNTKSVSIDNSMVTGAAAALNSGWETDPTQNILDGTGQLNVGDVLKVSYVVNIDPDISGASRSPFINQAAAEGDDPANPGTPVTDLSDDPTDTTNDDPNGDNNPDDPTLIEIADIGVAKQVNSVTEVGTGKFHVEYVVVVENTGTIDLLNINVTEDMVAEFGNGFDAVITGPTLASSNLSVGATLPNVNTSGWDGDGAGDPLLVNGGGLLKPADSFAITFTVLVDTILPDGTDTSPPGDFTNTVTATGEGPDGQAAFDESDDGTNPNGNNGDTSEDTRSPFLVPQIRAIKTHGTAVSSGDGSGNYTVPVSIEVINTGTVSMTNLTLTEDIASEFGNAFVGVANSQITAGSSFTAASTLPTLNLAWNTSNTAVGVIDNTVPNELAIGESYIFTFDVIVDPDEVDGSSQFNDNQATVSGDGKNHDGSTVTATDESGYPETSTDGIDNDDPTPLIIPEVILEKSILGQTVASSGTQGNVDVTYQFTYTNSGTVTLINPMIMDDWRAQYGDAFVRVVDIDLSNDVTAPPISGIDGNATYNGAAADNMLDGLGQLLPGESVTIVVTVEVDPDGDLAKLVNGQLVNQATAEGTYDPTPGTPGDEVVVDDASDDPTESTNSNPDGDGDYDDPNLLSVADIELTKDIVLVLPASSGMQGNIDVTFDLVVTNTGTESISDLSLLDDLATQYGGAFIGVESVTVIPGTATNAPTANASFNGTFGSDMLLGSATDDLQAGESFTVRLTVEVDPDNATANYDAVTGDGSGDFENSASVRGEGEYSGSVSDISDDSSDATDGDSEGDNDPDDPTSLIYPSITLDKTIVGLPVAATSGVAGNFEVTYDLAITNNGNEALNQIALTEDLASQYGGAFVRIVGLPAIVSTTATDDPELNAAYDGGTVDSRIFDNSGANSSLLDVRETVTVRIVIEVNPDASGAVYVNGNLENQASVSATGDQSGDRVDDLSDDPSDSEQEDPNTDNDPDDPNLVRFPAITLEKQIFGSPSPASSGAQDNYDVFYDLVITNTGSTDLDQLSLVEDFASNFGGAFVRVVSTPAIVASNASDNPEINSAFDGGKTDSQLFDNSGTNVNLLGVGESITVRVLVEIDPDNATATYDAISGDGNGDLENQASVTGTDFDDPAGPTNVDDNSDDPTDANNNDDDSDNDPDDPTAIILPNITLEKKAFGIPVVASSGTANNWDVTYHFTITNSGNESLKQLSLAEDLLAQYGGAFVRIVPQSGVPATIVSSSATDNPEINAAYDGGATDAQVFDNSGANTNLLPSGESITVAIVIEIDPDSSTAIYDASGNLVNQASTSGVGEQSGVTVGDLSDDSANSSDADPNSDNDPDDANVLRIPDIQLQKQKFGTPAPASSGTNGNYDVYYDLTVTNVGTTDLTKLSLIEDMATQFGGAFVRIVPQSGSPATIVSSTATDAPEINAAFDGGTTDAEIFDNSGANTNLLPVGESVTVRILVEVDPNNAGANYDAVTGDGNNDLENQAAAAGTDPIGGATVNDHSDDPTIATNNDDDSDNDPDDPTGLIIPEISLGKTLVGSPVPATSGTTGNYEITYDLQITNTGNDLLHMVGLTEDLASQYGGAFVQIVGTPSVVATTATDDPEINSSYDGGTSDARLFDNTGGNTNLLDINETVTVRIVIEIDPDSATATYVDGSLENQARTEGTGQGSGETVDDLSDDPNDLADEDGDPSTTSDDDNNPDDPNLVRIPLISLQKTLVSTPVPSISGTAGNFDATYEFALSNDGTTSLDRLTLVEDFATQFGGAFVGIVGTPIIVSSTATTAPVLNASFDGGTNDADVFDGISGQLDVNQTITVRIVAELDPDSATAVYDAITGDGNTDLENQASTTGRDFGDPAGPTVVNDTSDDPTDATNTDGDPANPSDHSDDDNDPDDPVSLIIPDVTLNKTLVGAPAPASSGTSGNVDLVYDLQIINTGNDPLQSLLLVEDLAAQYGGAFIGIVGTPSIVATTASDDPELNSLYDGGTTNSQLFDNAGSNTNLLDPAESVTVRIVIEVDPDNTTAIYSNGALQNQAQTAGTGTNSSQTVYDDSDDNSDNTNNDPDSDNNPDDPNLVRIPLISLQKNIVGTPVPATSGLQDNYDVTYQFTISNDGTTPLEGLTLLEDLATQFGGAFIRIVGTPSITASTATDDPGISAAFDGTSANANIFDGSKSLLDVNQTITVQVVVEVDPDNSAAIYDSLTSDGNGDLENLASTSGIDPVSGDKVDDNSDSPTDTSNRDDDSDNDPDDPTTLIIPNITLEKALIGTPTPAVSGIAGNFDLVYDLTVTNNGNEALNSLSLLEDLDTQYGGAFIRIVGTPTMTTSAATDNPEINSAYDGGTTDAQIFDNSGGNTNLLPVGESLTVRIVIEVDADAPGAIYTIGNLVNQATTAGTGDQSGQVVSDASDNPADTTNSDPNADNDPDDANPVRIPDITLEKAVTGSPVLASSGIVGNWDVTYTFTISNTGTTTLDTVTLTDDWGTHFGTGFVRVLPGSVSVTNNNAAIVPGANADYAGGATENMLDGTGSFDPGQSFDVTVVVEMDPNAIGAITTNNLFLNQADTMGTDTSTGVVVDDQSDSPTDTTDNDPDSDNNPDDPTATSFSDIGLAKRIVQSRATGTPGHYALTYEFVMKNIGSLDLDNLQLQDHLSATLGPGFQTVETLPFITASTATTDPNLNGLFNGDTNTDFFDGTSGLLKPNEQITIRVEVEIDIDQLTAASDNQGNASGNDGSAVVSDPSDTGSDPEGTNPDQTGDSGGEDDPTLPPAIGLVKDHGNPTPAGPDNREWSVPVTLVVQNLGLTDLTNLSLIEDIAREFDPAFISVDAPVIDSSRVTSGTAPGLNSSWIDDTSLDMLDGTGLLKPGDSFTIIFNVIVDPDVTGTSTTLENQAQITATDPDNPDLIVIDNSDSGTNPSSNNPDQPGDSGQTEDPTPLQIPDVGVGKQIVNVEPIGLQAKLTIDLIMENIGTVDLNHLILQDDFAAQYGANFVAVSTTPVIISSSATTDPTLNAAFDGSTDIGLFDGVTGLLKPGEDITVRLVVLVEAVPGQTSTVLENQAIGGGTAIDEKGNPVTDNSGMPLGPIIDSSDSGSDPHDNNPGQPGDTGGWDDPTQTPITFFTFDAFNDFSDPFGHPETHQHGGRMLSKEIHSLAPEPLFSGSARPGTKIVGRLFDENGFQIGSEEVYADVGGNWMMQVHELDKSRGTGYARVEFVEIGGIGQSFSPNGDVFGYLGQDKMDNDYAALEPWTPYEEHFDFIAIYRGSARVALASLHRKDSRSIGFGSQI